MSDTAPKYPGTEARAWFSPAQGYFIQRWGTGADGLLRAWIERAGVREAILVLPDDAVELGGNPTPWAYEQACKALHKHQARADDLQGRLNVLFERMGKALDSLVPPHGAWARTPETVLDQLLLEFRRIRPEVAEVAPTWDSAYTRLREIADKVAGGEDASTWSLVRRALTAAEGDPALHSQVVGSAAVLNVELSPDEEAPSWLG